MKESVIDSLALLAQRDKFYADIADGRLSISEIVIEMRKISRLTQADFAKHRGVSVDDIAGIEAGIANPTVDTLQKIVDIFGLKPGFVPKHPHSFQNFGELADAAKNAADRASASVDDALSFVEKSNLRIASLEKGARTGTSNRFDEVVTEEVLKRAIERGRLRIDAMDHGAQDSDLEPLSQKDHAVLAHSEPKTRGRIISSLEVDKVTLNVNITDELNLRLDQMAEKSGNSKSDLLRKAIVLMEFAIYEKEKGNVLAVTDGQNHVLREIVGI